MLKSVFPLVGEVYWKQEVESNYNQPTGRPYPVLDEVSELIIFLS